MKNKYHEQTNQHGEQYNIQSFYEQKVKPGEQMYYEQNIKHHEHLIVLDR